MPALPGCIISDQYAELSPTDTMVGLPSTIMARASLSPLFVRQDDGSWLEHANVVISTTTSSGTWTLVLPSQTNSDPNTVTWKISLPDGTVWGGAVTDAMVTASHTTPLTLHDLKNTYSWGLVAGGAGGTISAIQGANFDATTTAIGSVLIDQAPSSGHPVALTVPRLGAASGVCDLDSGTKVPLGRLPSSVALTTAANTFTAGPNIFRPATAAAVGLQVKGLASQSADLQQWQDSTGAVLARLRITADGNADILARYIEANGNITGSYLDLVDGQPISVRGNHAAVVGFMVQGAASQTADLQQWQDSTGAVLAKFDAYGDIFNSGSYCDITNTGPYISLLPAHALLNTRTATNVGLVVQGASGQTADLLDLDTSQSSTTYPATIAFTNLSAGKAWRALGTSTDVLQSGYGQCMQVVSYFPLQLWGHAQNYSGPLPYQSGAFSDALPAPSVILNISEAQDVGLAIRGFASQTADLQQWQDSASHTQFGVANAGSGGSPIWALRIRALANAESMGQAHTLGSYSGKSIQVLDDAGATVGWIPLYA